MSSGGTNVKDNDVPNNYMSLPPLHQVLPLFEAFIVNFNSVLPLFDASALLRLLHDYYSVPSQQRDPVAWAAINMVLAITYQEVVVDASSNKRTAEHFANVQSVLPSVMLGDVRLLNVQTLVGMVILLQGPKDLHPSLIMLAAAMRLVHKLRLHDRTASMHLDSSTARQHARVFWIAYILDKSLSLRAKQPSLQLDEDINLDLPEAGGDDYRFESSDDADNPSMDAGMITTTDGSAKVNYFLARVQLANIEGGVYDYLYSTRSQRRSPEERAAALENIVQALDQWKASLPPAFGATAVLRSVPPDRRRFFCVLYSTSLMCMTVIKQANAYNSQWVVNLREHSRGIRQLQFPSRWEALVNEARDFMMLFTGMMSADPNPAR
jgi:hypothetical protein